MRIPLPAFGDAVAPAILLAQAIGRLGNWFNQELYGRETTAPWGLEIYERVDSRGAVDSLNGASTGVVERVVHPTFLYEMLWNLLIVVVLVLVDRRFRIGHGRLFALYVAGYCLGRFFVELMRDDYATHIAGIRINSFTSTIVFVARSPTSCSRRRAASNRGNCCRRTSGPSRPHLQNGGRGVREGRAGRRQAAATRATTEPPDGGQTDATVSPPTSARILFDPYGAGSARSGRRSTGTISCWPARSGTDRVEARGARPPDC